jgi:NNP family nitrate/nitrite transporter-like MFS transporter
MMSENQPERGQPSAPASGRSIRANLATILLLVFVFFFLFTARIIYSPLLLAIEESLGIGHAEAASFFLFITLGYGAMMLMSGFVAAAIGHRSTILLAVLLSMLGLLVVFASSTLWGIRGGLILLGVGAGLYFPSGIPTLTSLVEDKDEGKVLAIHEVGPNAAFVISPIAAGFALHFFSWQAILALLACVGAAAGLSFLFLAKGGRSRGKPPHLANARLILGKSSFWIMTALFSLGAGAGVGVFSVTPAYLVAERGMDPELVSTLVGLSRLSGLVVIFVAGYLVDRLGAQRVISFVMLSAGAATACLGLASQPLLIAAVFLQPILIACYFPAGFAAVSRVAPRDMHNLTISFMFPIGYAVGSGVVPLLLGLLGDHLSFALGFLLYGVLLMSSSALPLFLKLRQNPTAEAAGGREGTAGGTPRQENPQKR